MNLLVSQKQAGIIIFLRDRDIAMLKKDLIIRNPLRHLGYENDDIIPVGGFGAVLSRAGVGKTAFLVQYALNAMLRDKHILHISLNDPVDKVTLWYNELFIRLAQHYEVEQINRLWENILPNRFIMTFRIDSFTVPKLEERLYDLSQQDIFKPDMIIIDGLHFDESVQEYLTDLKNLSLKQSCQTWFSVHTHRHEEPGLEGIPQRLSDVKELFEVVLKLQPSGTEIKIEPLKGAPVISQEQPLYLDASTMLIKE
jgi:hypothetical protein